MPCWQHRLHRSQGPCSSILTRTAKHIDTHGADRPGQVLCAVQAHLLGALQRVAHAVLRVLGRALHVPSSLQHALCQTPFLHSNRVATCGADSAKAFAKAKARAHSTCKSPEQSMLRHCQLCYMLHTKAKYVPNINTVQAGQAHLLCRGRLLAKVKQTRSVADSVVHRALSLLGAKRISYTGICEPHLHPFLAHAQGA